MTRDDVMASRGMVMYEGKYVTPQHVELLERQKKQRCRRPIGPTISSGCGAGSPAGGRTESAEAHAEIQAIRDPAAAEAVVAMLRAKRSRSEAAVARSRVAARPSAAVDALVDRLAGRSGRGDSPPEPGIPHQIGPARLGDAVRSRTEESGQRNRQPCRRRPRPDRRRRRDRPAYRRAVTKHKFKVSDANPDQHAYTFSPEGGGFSFGGSGPKFVTETLRNPAVLDALVTLSGGTSFDYDQDQWRRWLAAQAKQQCRRCPPR